MFAYNCPNCNAKMNGMSSENVYCQSCDVTFETTCDLVNEHTNKTHRYEGWLTGKSIKGYFGSQQCWDWENRFLKFVPFGMITCTKCRGYTFTVDKYDGDSKYYIRTCDVCKGSGYIDPPESVVYLPYKTLSVR